MTLSRSLLVFSCEARNDDKKRKPNTNTNVLTPAPSLTPLFTYSRRCHSSKPRPPHHSSTTSLPSPRSSQHQHDVSTQRRKRVVSLGSGRQHGNRSGLIGRAPLRRRRRRKSVLLLSVPGRLIPISEGNQAQLPKECLHPKGLIDRR